MNIIVPAAGKSTRFPNMKPKYLLYDYLGKTMIRNAVEPWIGKHRIVIGILKEHDEMYSASEIIRNDIPDAVIVVLDEPTSGPAETVSKIIDEAVIFTDSIFIKDCDSFFDVELDGSNMICVSHIDQHDVLKKLSSKSFVTTNDQGIVLDIVEKKVVSNNFCVGGYGFRSSWEFKDAYNSLSKDSENFISHVIMQAILSKETFTASEITNYADVGTAEDWFEYNDRPTIFCDIDGTLIMNQNRVGRDSYKDDPIPLEQNLQIIVDAMKRGCQVIFTTSRPESAFEDTKATLQKIGIPEPIMVLGNLHNARRIVINDYNNANPFPRAVAINIPRNSDTLKDYFE